MPESARQLSCATSAGFQRKRLPRRSGSPPSPSAAICEWRKPGFTTKCETARCSLTPGRWAEVEEVFHRVVESDPEQRSLVLDEACSNDSELRELVEALLSSDKRARSRMQSAVRSEYETFAFPLTG